MWVFVPELKRSRITLVEWDLEGKSLLVVESRFNLFQGFLGMGRLHWVLWKIISIAQRSIYSEKMVNKNWILGCPFTRFWWGVYEFNYYKNTQLDLVQLFRDNVIQSQCPRINKAGLKSYLSRVAFEFSCFANFAHHIP